MFVKFPVILALIFGHLLYAADIYAGAETVFYVSVKGNDSWSGKLNEPDVSGKDGPFATLERARDAVRVLHKEKGLSEKATVFVRGGKYYLNHTFILAAEDSGSKKYPVSYEAYKDEIPVISGGYVVTGWKTYKGNIYRAELPFAKGGKWKSRQFFCEGKRQTRARWPKFDPADSLFSGWAYTHVHYTDRYHSSRGRRACYAAEVGGISAASINGAPTVPSGWTRGESRVPWEARRALYRGTGRQNTRRS